MMKRRSTRRGPCAGGGKSAPAQSVVRVHSVRHAHARCRRLGLALEPHGADLLRSPVSRLRHARRRPPITDACLVPRGDLFLAAVVCSPLDLLARQYLFTAEAVEQMLVGLVAAHLLVLGTPEKANQLVLPKGAKP